MLEHGATIKHVLKSAAVLVLIAVLLETFVFNINYFRTAGYHRRGHQLPGAAV